MPKKNGQEPGACRADGLTGAARQVHRAVLATFARTGQPPAHSGLERRARSHGASPDAVRRRPVQSCASGRCGSTAARSRSPAGAPRTGSLPGYTSGISRVYRRSTPGPHSEFGEPDGQPHCRGST
jgi:hypothetical protein